MASDRRRTFLSTSSNNNRSSFLLPSNHSILPNTSVSSSTLISNNNSSSSSNQNKDPRPLRDRNYQNVIIQDILDYLIRENFSKDTNLIINLKILRQPTQRDFITIFKWCYLKIDPGYMFNTNSSSSSSSSSNNNNSTSNVENHIYNILKILQYPFLNSISKSQISAAGGTNWFKFLGLLHWLIQLIIQLEDNLYNIDENINIKDTQDMTILTNNEDLIIMDSKMQFLKIEKYEMMVERLFIDYLFKCYKLFMSNSDDYSEYYNKLLDNFKIFEKIINNDLIKIDLKNKSLLSKYSEFMSSIDFLNNLKKNNTILKDDLLKINKYNSLMDLKKKNIWQTKINEIKQEIDNKKNIISGYLDKINEFQKILDSKGFSIADINGKLTKQTLIMKDLTKLEMMRENLQISNKSFNLDFDKLFDTLQQITQHYNSITDFLLPLQSQYMNTDSGTTTNLFKFELNDKAQESIIEIQQNLIALNNKINTNLDSIQDTNYKLESQIQSLQQRIQEKSTYMESLENKYSTLKIQIDISKQNEKSKILQQEIEIEKLENKIRSLNKQSVDFLQDTQQKILEMETTYQDLLAAHRGKLLSIISKFKETTSATADFKKNFDESLHNCEKELDKLYIDE